MNTTVPLPPWMRRIQQGFFYQAVLVPFIIGFGGFLLANGCLSNGIFSVAMPCLKTAFSAWVISAITVFISGKSVGSPDFHTDGTPNRFVNNVVKIQQGADDGHPDVTPALTALANQVGAVADTIKATPKP